MIAMGTFPCSIPLKGGTSLLYAAHGRVWPQFFDEGEPHNKDSRATIQTVVYPTLLHFIQKIFVSYDINTVPGVRITEKRECETPNL